METKTLRADDQGRVSLFQDFADKEVVLERINENEVRITKARSRAKRYTLAELVEKITPETLHEEVSTGPSVGAEEW